MIRIMLYSSAVIAILLEGGAAEESLACESVWQPIEVLPKSETAGFEPQQLRDAWATIEIPSIATDNPLTQIGLDGDLREYAQALRECKPDESEDFYEKIGVASKRLFCPPPSNLEITQCISVLCQTGRNMELMLIADAVIKEDNISLGGWLIRLAHAYEASPTDFSARISAGIGVLHCLNAASGKNVDLLKQLIWLDLKDMYRHMACMTKRAFDIAMKRDDQHKQAPSGDFTYGGVLASLEMDGDLRGAAWDMVCEEAAKIVE
jgi:hypothetical protein